MSETVGEITFQQAIIHQCLLFLDPALRSETSKPDKKTEQRETDPAQTEVNSTLTSWFTMETRTAKNTHVHRHTDTNTHTLCLINTSFLKSRDYTTQQ